jgi:hypothetical protein
MMKNINIVVILFRLTSQIQAQDAGSKTEFGIKSGINSSNGNNEISSNTFYIEQGANTFSTLGGIWGAAFGIGWEGCRFITTLDWYENWRKNTWLPFRRENFGN